MNNDIKEILKILPHRYPFLLVDKILDVELGKKIIAVKNVSINEPQFNGHFPDQPIMPGVLIIEALAQAAGLLVAKSLDITKDGKSIYLTGIESAKFRHPVQPGDILELRVEVIQNRGPMWKFSGKALVEDRIVSESSFLALIQDK
jgi:3-hydroxyacyl-[acyl-carrier-protein] dehydratase